MANFTSHTNHTKLEELDREQRLRYQRCWDPLLGKERWMTTPITDLEYRWFCWWCDDAVIIWRHGSLDSLQKVPIAFWRRCMDQCCFNIDYIDWRSQKLINDLSDRSVNIFIKELIFLWRYTLFGIFLSILPSILVISTAETNVLIYIYIRPPLLPLAVWRN
jgi:hypothetical protein